MIVGLFQQSDEGERHDGREGQDDRCPTCRQAPPRRARRRAAGRRGLDGTRADGGRRQRQARRRARRAQPQRLTHRNGYRSREWDTRVGSIELAIPKLRQGSYFPSFLEPRRRAEQALVAVVQEAYANGVSTRKVDRLVEQMGLQGMSKDQVSRLCRGLDEQVRIFRERPLQGAYPYLWLDAKVERAREPGGVRPKALVIAYGVHESGRREVIGLDVGEAETESFWREFLRGLRARGLDGVRLCISDAHAGLNAAIAQVLGCPWQRCTVHFLRDMLGHVTRAQQPLVSGAIGGIFTATTRAEARARLGQVVDQLRAHAPRSLGC
jgi:putative transposase